MNYRYTWNGVDTDCDSYGNEENDFSRGLRTQLDENSLDESKGVCGNVPIDWNYDGIINSGVQLDLNPSVCAGTYSVLKDYNDWANIEIDMSLTGNEDGPMPEEAIVCPAVPFVPKESP